MSNTLTYSLILSDDPLFSKRLKTTLSENEVSKDWRTLVFSNNPANESRDFKFEKLFELILKIKKVHLIVFFDFDSNQEFMTNLLAIFNKYSGATQILQIAFFGEKNTKEELESSLYHGCHMVEYKRPDIEDIVTNIMILKNPAFNAYPNYATAEGYNSVYWPKFFGKIDFVNYLNVNITTTFDKINPDEKWINKFMPTLTSKDFVIGNSRETDRKCRWLEDINTLKFEYKNQLLINNNFLNVNNVFKNDNKTFTFKTSKRISPEKILDEEKKIKKYFNSLVSEEVRVMAFDPKLKILNAKKQDSSFNLFTLPYLSLNEKDFRNSSPHIIAIEWDNLIILDENSNVLKASDDQKVSYLESYLNKFIKEETIIIVFGLNDISIKNLAKVQLNVHFSMNLEFIEKIVNVFKQKNNVKFKVVNDSVSGNEFNILKLDKILKLEIPIIVEKLNEHRILFSSPMLIENNSIIKIDLPCPMYILVLDQLSKDGIYGGLIMGVDEYEKSLIRMEVNRLLRIPKELEAQQDLIGFREVNNKVIIERQKEDMKKKKDVIYQLNHSKS